MDKKTPAPTTKPWKRIELGLFILCLIFIAVIHQAALKDRLLLVLYCLGTGGTSYALVKRRALGLAAMIGAITAATIFAATYYATEPEVWHPWVDPIRDMAGLAVLILLTAKIILEMYRYEKQEKQRQMRQLMEEKTVEMRAAALRSTSHEVRTPLATITALTETLLDGSTGSLNDLQQEFLEDIDDAAKHLLMLINDILDFAKAEAGMIQLAPESVAVQELVEQCVGMVQPRADAAGVQLSAYVDADTTEIIADPLRLKQILLNLLSNGVKYNETGGSVTVRVRPDGDSSVLIAVRDTGRGIPAEHMDHLFDPYYQAAVADQSIGTGLGLAIIKHLTELHGGTVSVESVVNAGSVFQVRLPTVISREASEKQLACKSLIESSDSLSEETFAATPS